MSKEEEIVVIDVEKEEEEIVVIDVGKEEIKNNNNSNKHRTIHVECANPESKTNTSAGEGDESVENIALNSSINGKKESLDNNKARRKKKAWKKKILNRKPSPLLWNPVIKATAKTFTEHQLSEFREIFTLFDKDRSGSITCRELITVLKCLGQDPEEDEIKDIINSLDANGDGVIEFSEFLNLMAQLMMDRESEAELVDVFRVLDQDDDGNITLRDLKVVSTVLGLNLEYKDIEEMMAEVDKDGDGLIQFDEFRLIVTSRI